MTTWYKTSFGSWNRDHKITAIEVERHTDSSVFIRGRRRDRESTWAGFFPTWGEAHAYLLANSARCLVASRRELEQAQGVDGNIRGMKEPQA